MEAFIVEGGHRLSRAITPHGDKNDKKGCVRCPIFTDSMHENSVFLLLLSGILGQHAQ